MSRAPLILFGAGGLGREVALLVQAIEARAPAWELLGFVDDGGGESNLGLPILGGFEALVATASRRGRLAVAIAIGRCEHLAAVAARVRAALGDAVWFPNLIHPDATAAPRVLDLGEGNIVAAGARLANVTLGSFNVINMNTVLGHDVTVGDCTLIHPSATICGAVSIGSGVTVGAGATVLPGLAVGDGCTVVAGSVVGQPVRPGDTVAGNPARVVKRG